MKDRSRHGGLPGEARRRIMKSFSLVHQEPPSPAAPQERPASFCCVAKGYGWGKRDHSGTKRAYDVISGHDVFFSHFDQLFDEFVVLGRGLEVLFLRQLFADCCV